MVKKNLLVIVCQTPGSQDDIVPELETVLKDFKESHTLLNVKTPPEVTKMIKTKSDDYSTIAVYGGDGSIVSAIKALANHKQRLLILPGGTANTIASALNLTNSAPEILRMYTEGRYSLHYYDIASAGSRPFVLDMHSGWWTEAIKQTPRDLKKRFGPIAYGISAIKNLPEAEAESYELEINGKRIQFKSYTTLIANQGFQNFLGLPLFPKKHRNGILQVAVVKSLSPERLLLWVFGRSVGRRNLGGAIKTYRTNQLTIHKAPKGFVYDDSDIKVTLPLTIKGGQLQTKIIVAPTEAKNNSLSRFILFFNLNVVRFAERFRSLVSGTPKFSYTHLAPNLYVGGTYRNSAYRQFKKWGVTGVVNMRKSPPRADLKEIKILHLKTRDWTPPSLEALAEGVAFIEARIAKGEGVYVHCRQGEGRGPTMAAAYLISQGLTVEEAIAQIKKGRPMAHPNRSQITRLSEWQEAVNTSQK